MKYTVQLNESEIKEAIISYLTEKGIEVMKQRGGWQDVNLSVKGDAFSSDPLEKQSVIAECITKETK